MQVPAGTSEDVIVQNLLSIRDSLSATSKPIARAAGIQSQSQAAFPALFRFKAGQLQVATILGSNKFWNNVPTVDASAPDQEQV